MKKKELKKELKKLQGDVVFLEDTIQQSNDQIRVLQLTCSTWREKYELLLHTPEYKADTEAAFNRGVDATKTKFRAWLIEAAGTIEVKDES